MRKIVASTRRKAMHPLFCWDIVLHQLSSIHYRWDLSIIENKKRQYNWKMDFHSILQKGYHSFLVVDSSCRIFCRSKRATEFLKHLSQSSSFAQLTRFQRLQRLLTNRQPDIPFLITNIGIAPNFIIKIFPIAPYENRRSHFFVLVSLHQ
jgi:hypothetical protein